MIFLARPPTQHHVRETLYSSCHYDGRYTGLSVIMAGFKGIFYSDPGMTSLWLMILWHACKAHNMRRISYKYICSTNACMAGVDSGGAAAVGGAAEVSGVPLA